MTDYELLLEISIMLDPLRNSIRGIKSDIQEMKGKIQLMESDIQEIKSGVTKVETTPENEINPRLQKMEASYTSNFDRYKNSADDYKTLKQDISLLKKVIDEHNEKLQRIG